MYRASDSRSFDLEKGPGSSYLKKGPCNEWNGVKTTIEQNVCYIEDGRKEQTPYRRERCRLDVYPASEGTGNPVVVWFHGGGLYAGEKGLPAGLRDQGFVVMPANYRLSPQAVCPDYLEDAAAAVAWAFRHAEEYGGSPEKIFVAGHSAGAYLAAMIGLDKRWLATLGLDADRLAGLVPLSGQAITHLTIRKEKGIESVQPVIDSFAPLFHVRPTPFPILLITGDREKEMLGRYEENAYLQRMLKLNGNTRSTLYELQGYGHGMEEPAMPLVREFIRAACGVTE